MFIPMLAAAAAVMAPGDLAVGTISIGAAPHATVPAETSRIFDDAVRRAALRVGFTPLPGEGHGRYIATVQVTRTSRGVVTSDLPPSPAPLASLNGSVTLSLPPGGDRLSDLVVTELTVAIARRGDQRVVWSGSAVTARVTGTRAGAIDVVAQTLADAVLGQFPRQAPTALSIP